LHSRKHGDEQYFSCDQRRSGNRQRYYVCQSAATRQCGLEQHSIAADPLFVDISREDFRLQPDSPALKLGIQQPFDVRKAGVQKTP